MRQSLLALGIVLMVVLAGCGGASTQTSATTTNGEPKQTTTAPSEIDSYPAGATASGITNFTSLYQGHEHALNETGTYRVQLHINTDTSTITYTRAVSDNGTKTKTAGSDSTLQTWNPSDQRGKYLRLQGSSRYYSVGETRASIATASSPLSRSLVPIFLSAGNYSKAEPVMRGGTTMIRYTANRVRSNFTEQTNVTAYNATIVVDQQGRIRSADASLTEQTETGPQTSELNYEVSGVGSTTVSAPSWAAAIPTIGVEHVQDGVLRLTNTGDTTIGSEAVVTVGFSSRPLNDSIKPGSSVYVVKGDDSVTVRRTEPASAAGSFTSATTVGVKTQDSGSALVQIAAVTNTGSQGNETA